LWDEGARVAITAAGERVYERARELDTSGARASAFVADLTDEFHVRALVASVLNRYGRIDVLVNNAGMATGGQQPGQ
jgi:3-oxoacyl-[acyl-carrier protein] reductase